MHCHLLWAKALRQLGKLSCGQTNPNLKFFLENTDEKSSGGEGPSVLSLKACISHGMWVDRSHEIGSLHTWQNIIAERYLQVLEQHVLPSRWRLFQGRPCIVRLNETKLNHILHLLQPHSFGAELQFRPFTIKNSWHTMKYNKEDRELLSS